METNGLILATLHKYVNDKTLRAIIDRIPTCSVITADQLIKLMPANLEDKVKTEFIQGINEKGELEWFENEFRKNNIEVLPINHVDYPTALLDLRQPPPVIYLKGDRTIIQSRGIGICGSRNASDDGITYAHRFGEKVAELNVTEVSGYAKGVDTEAHLGALDAGGCTAVVMAEGILNFNLKKPFRDRESILDRMVIISEFHPTRPWHVSNAMRRNKTICALSNGMVVVEAQDSGGTLDAGKECLNQNKPLIVIEYDDPSKMPKGNSILIQKGGLPVKSMGELSTQLERITQLDDTTIPGPIAEQLSLEASRDQGDSIED